MRFGQRVKQLRKEQNITQSQLAFEAELSREHISRMEHEKMNIGLETALGLCAGFWDYIKGFI